MTDKITEFVKYSKTESFDVTILQESEEESYILQDINISTELQTTVRAYVLLTKNPKPSPGVFFVHWLETHADDSNRDQFLPMARELAEMGINSILPDCFWSVSSAEDFEKNPKKYTTNWWKTDIDHDRELIRKQIIELKTAEDYFLSLDRVDAKRTIVAAHDFGAMSAILLGQLDFIHSGYVLMAFTSRWSDWFRFGSKLSDEELEPFVQGLEDLAPLNLIENLASKPLFLLFGDDDFYVPKERVEAIFDRAKEPKQKTIYQAQHGMNPRAFNDMKEWIIKQLLDQND